jgi:hypothetical protein
MPIAHSLETSGIVGTAHFKVAFVHSTRYTCVMIMLLEWGLGKGEMPTNMDVNILCTCNIFGILFQLMGPTLQL